jgi:RNA polymerase sigma-70 factor (ECF subfamily)
MKGQGEAAMGAARRDDMSVEGLFRAHAGFVASFLFRLGVARQDVDDRVQDVFLIAHRKGGYEAGPATPRSWLGAIAVRVASHHRRSQRRRREDAADLDRLAAGTSPERAAEVAAAMRRVDQALASLDLDHRAVFVMFEIEGEACPAIAAALGVPVGTVYSRLHHARARFREAYEALDRPSPAHASERR